MTSAFIMIFGFIVIFWLVFYKFKWIKLTITWGIVSAFFFLHIFIIFMIGLRFVAPLSTDSKVIQHTIQLTPRLSAPTLVTAVLVKPNVPVKKGTPLFQFDRRPYQYQVNQLEAKLIQAEQDVQLMKTDIIINSEKVTQLTSELDYAKFQQQLSQDLANQGAGPIEDAKKWAAQVAANTAAINGAQAEELRARLRYQSQIDGVNTNVASIRAELDLAKYYLNNTLMVAPEDGSVINLQVRPGMVAGEARFGSIASFICDDERYVLATFFQENLKYVKPGQPVEIAFDLYPGQIFNGEVQAIWQGSGDGQLLPTGVLPTFMPVAKDIPQGQFAVAIKVDDKNQRKFPIGAQGRAAIYTDPNSGFIVLRKIGIRMYSWLNWIYPFSG
jgi:multidrug resistance efflux pump